MDHVHMLARIFGPFFTIVGVWMLYKNEDAMRKIWNGVKGNVAFLHLGGMINLLIGFTMLSLYNSWSMSLAVLLTIVGWMMVIRGLVTFFRPDLLIAWSEKAMSHWKKMAYIPLVIGLLLSYLAFFS